MRAASGLTGRRRAFGLVVLAKLTESVALTAFTALVSGGACSLVTHEDASQCDSDAGCEQRFPGQRTQCNAGVCQPRSTTFPGEDAGLSDLCVSNQDCLATRGEFFRCRPEDGACIPILSDDCSTVLGLYKSDRSILFGALLPLDGQHSDGVPLRNAMQLVAHDFEAVADPSRPIAFVACDDSVDPRRAAKHLIEDLGVPALVARPVDAVSLVAREHGVVLLSPLRHVPAQAQPGGPGGSGDPGDLVYQLVPPALAQATVLADSSRKLEPRVSPDGLFSVALFHEGDAHGQELYGALVPKLTIGGSPVTDPGNQTRWIDVPLGDAAAPGFSTNVAAAVAALATHDPPIRIVVVVGSAPSRQLLEAFATLGGDPQTFPFFVLSEGLKTPSLLATVGDDTVLRSHVVGASSGPDQNLASTTELFLRYREAFKDGSDPGTAGVLQAYDAAYLLGFATAALGGQNVSGASLSSSFDRLRSGTSFAVGPVGLTDALSALTASSSSSIHLRGVSGPLDFDPVTHDTGAIVSTWCLSDADGTLTFLSPIGDGCLSAP